MSLFIKTHFAIPYFTYILNLVIMCFRYLRRLKRNVANKARVEGSIANAYLVEEATKFCSHYFEPSVYTRQRRIPRNSGGDVDPSDGMLKIFSHPGRTYGRSHNRFMDDEEYKAAQLYVLMNCEEVFPFQQ